VPLKKDTDMTRIDTASTSSLHEHTVHIHDEGASSPPPTKSPDSSLPGLKSQGNPIPESSGSPRRMSNLPKTNETSGIASPSATTPAVSPEMASVENVSRTERTATLARLESDIDKAANRAVQLDVAAKLVNDLRITGPGAHASGGTTAPAVTNADMMKRITDDHVKEWYGAQGLSEQEVGALRRSALLSGLPNPTGSLVTNVVQYIVAPWASYAADTPWAGTGIGIGAMLATPPVNAFQQSAVVEVATAMREHGGPVIANSKDSINDKNWLPELSKELKHEVEQFSALHVQMNDTLTRLNLGSAGYTDATLKPLLEALPASDLLELRQQGEQLLNAEKRLHDKQRDFLMTQGAHARQWEGNKWQALPRTLRAPVASVTGLVSKTKAAGALSPALQTVAAVTLTVGQHIAAGFDERAKQEYNNKLNLLYGDLFTDGGKQKLARGEPLVDRDIDAAKLRDFTQTPAQSLVKHVSTEVKRQIETINAQLNPPPDTPSAPLSAQDRATLETHLASLTADADKLKKGKLSELRPGGMAETLVIASDKSVLSQQLLNDVKAKYTFKEWSAQTIQRYGQAGHLFAFGSGASSVIGKLTSAFKGGAKEAPTKQTLGIAALSGFMAYVGATNQQTAISVKNNRRESKPDIGAGQQLWRGIKGGAEEWFAQNAGEKASLSMNEKLKQNDTVATLQFAKAVQGHFGSVPLPETTSHVMTPDEAAQQLRPGHITQAGAGHIAIDMESLSPKKSDPAESSSAGQERPVRDQPASASASDKGKAPMVDDGKSA
jgi:hypothetical protein